jgi:glutathione synthase/RimK-type ligase-like ATP-grasp enzyme
MMGKGRIAILTPDPGDEGFRTRWAQVLERNAEPLRRAGLEVEGVSWTADADWSAFDLVLPLLVWGYPRAHARWVERVTELEERGVPLQNAPSVLRWNADKIYLGQIADRGAPVVPTLYFSGLTEAAMTVAAERFGTTELVAKPQVSSTAWQTIRWSEGASLEGGPEGAAMVQPYLPEIERSGETSMIFFAGRFSHAIRKVPQPGDFRVQPEYDGIITRYDPAPDEHEAAERILAAVDEDLLYARIDLVRGLGGSPELIELELIEPDLYLGYDPEEGRHFAEAILEQIGR